MKMHILLVGSLQFSFPLPWLIGKFDDWAYYRNQFMKIKPGIKAVDIIAVDPLQTTWLIEVKDYRQNQRTKAIDLSDEMAGKVLGTLAALLPAKIYSSNSQEKELAHQALLALQLRVVLHLEQPEKHSKLFPRGIKPEDIQQKMRRKLKSIDPHPLVLEMKRMTSVSWKVS